MIKHVSWFCLVVVFLFSGGCTSEKRREPQDFGAGLTPTRVVPANDRVGPVPKTPSGVVTPQHSNGFGVKPKHDTKPPKGGRPG